MDQLSLMKWTRRQPFEPYRICLTDGTSYEIRHQGLVMPTQREAVVGIAGPKGTAREVTFVCYSHIVKIEPLDPLSQLPATDGKEEAGGA